MRKKLEFKEILLIGSLLFGLFFGAGNLIFPFELGQNSGYNLTPVAIGFLLSGVGLPILGVIGTALADSDSLFDLSTSAGRKFAYFFTVLLYLTIGPGFAIPRTASMSYTTAFGNNPTTNQTIGLAVFSAVFLLIALYFALQKSKLVDTIGKVLSPMLLILLAIIVLFGIFKPMGPVGAVDPSEKYISSPFTVGFIDGYNTLDAPASLAFAVIIISAIKNFGVKKPGDIAIETAKSSVVCLLGMSLVYVSLAVLGSASANIMERGENGAIILGFISKHYTGGLGHILLSAIVTVACIKTSIGLISACADVFVEMFDNNLTYNQYCYIFAGVSFLIANLGLSKIISLTIPVLMFLYPLSIVLIILALLTKYIHRSETIYKWTLGFTAIPAFFDLLNAAPEISKNPAIVSLTNIPRGILPGYDLGFGWILPAVIGFIIGVIIDKTKNKSRINYNKKVYEAGR